MSARSSCSLSVISRAWHLCAKVVNGLVCNRVIQVCRDEGDSASRELFERLLKDEVAHVDWLEAQIHQIGEMGYERYLSQQIREEK